MNMDTNREWERRVEGALRDQAERMDQMLSDHPEREAAMRRRVNRRIEEETKMRHTGWNIRKTLAAACVMCVLGSAVVMASGGFTQLAGHSSWKETIESYDQLDELTETYSFSFEPKAPESFENGFAFASAVPVHSSGTDEAGNETELPVGISLEYTKEGEASVTLEENPVIPGDNDHSGASVHQVGGRTYYVTKDHYRFVPPSYELSEEEQAAVDAGELLVSYGSDAVQDSWVSYVSWEENGISYLLMSFDTGLTEEEMVAMAGEVME